MIWIASGELLVGIFSTIASSEVGIDLDLYLDLDLETTETQSVEFELIDIEDSTTEVPKDQSSLSERGDTGPLVGDSFMNTRLDSETEEELLDQGVVDANKYPTDGHDPLLVENSASGTWARVHADTSVTSAPVRENTDSNSEEDDYISSETDHYGDFEALHQSAVEPDHTVSSTGDTEIETGKRLANSNAYTNMIDSYEVQDRLKWDAEQLQAAAEIVKEGIRSQQESTFAHNNERQRLVLMSDSEYRRDTLLESKTTMPNAVDALDSTSIDQFENQKDIPLADHYRYSLESETFPKKGENIPNDSEESVVEHVVLESEVLPGDVGDAPNEDDRTLLDIFGEVAKEYLTQRVVSFVNVFQF